MQYSPRSLLTKQAKRPCLLCQCHLARQVLQGQNLVKHKSMKVSDLGWSRQGTLPVLLCTKPAGGKELETQGPALELTLAI